MLVRLVQSMKAHNLINVTLFGIVTEVRLVHLLKSSLCILVTLFGIVMDLRLVQSIESFPPYGLYAIRNSDRGQVYAFHECT